MAAGDSDTDEHLFGDNTGFNCAHIERHPCVPGLVHVREWLTPRQQIYSTGWFDPPGSNQAMRFGQLPPWALALVDAFPAHLLPPPLSTRSPLFDQIIVNLYRPGDGLSPHVDLARFQDGIASVSFGGPAVMAFTHDAQPQRHPEHRVLLLPGDLLLMYGEARHGWQHGIAAVTEEPWPGRPGEVVKRGTRVSITFRRMCEGIVLTDDT